MKPEVTIPAPATHPEELGGRLPELVRSWNETATPYPRSQTVARLFEQVAAETPEAIALTLGNRQLTYQELNRRANRLARQLLRSDMLPETMVACCLERSIEMIVAFLAVLKAGGAYVPIDPAYPREQIDFLLADTNTPIFLTQQSCAPASAARRSVTSIFLDEGASITGERDDENPESSAGPASLAYLMYTSGSTGRPKGVMIENRAIVRLVRDTNYCHFGKEEVFLLFAPVSFDASTLEIWGPLLNGGRLVIMPPQVCSLADLGKAIREHGVTTLWLTAGLFHLMVEQRLEDLQPLRQLLAGGDVLSPRHVRAALEALPDCTLINGYGPTENTTFTCCHRMRHGEPVEEPIRIGRPISNTRVYVLDAAMQPLPPGEPGELYSGGDGVARGYWKRPEDTAEKFLPDPFSEVRGARMYRTGDLAVWQKDGVLEFLGRADDQVKILGYRVEPGEVEAALAGHLGLSQVCVAPRAGNDGARRLVAYYLARPGGNASPQELRRYLAEKLPAHMVPAAFVQLDAFPLSPNGKVNRGALPVPVLGSNGDRAEAPPANELERHLLGLWKQVLHIDHAGLDDNFFDLGGDSLLLVAVHSNLQKQLHIEIEVTDLFEFATIRSLAQHLAGKRPRAATLGPEEVRGGRQREAFSRQRRVSCNR